MKALGAIGVGVLGLSLLGCGGAKPGPAGSAESAGESGSNVNVTPPEQGAKGLEHRSVSLTFELVLSKGTAAGGMQSGSWSIDEERSLELQGASADAITKLKVTFGKREAKPLLEVETDSATSGHSYLVATAATGAEITRDDGAVATEPERDSVKAEYGWVGQPNPMVRWVASLQQGKRSPGGEREARALLGELPAVDHKQTEIFVTLKSKSESPRPSAELDVEAKVRVRSGETQFLLELAGPAKVDLRTGFVTDLALSGEVKASGKLKHKKGDLDVTGKGKAEIKRTTSL